MTKTTQHFRMNHEIKTMIQMTADKIARDNLRRAMIDAQAVFDSNKRKKISEPRNAKE
jgi:hypothetical protein